MNRTEYKFPVEMPPIDGAADIQVVIWMERMLEEPQELEINQLVEEWRDEATETGFGTVGDVMNENRPEAEDFMAFVKSMEAMGNPDVLNSIGQIQRCIHGLNWVFDDEATLSITADLGSAPAEELMKLVDRVINKIQGYGVEIVKMEVEAD